MQNLEQLKQQEALIELSLSDPDAHLGDPYEALAEIRRQIRNAEMTIARKHCAMAIEGLSSDIAFCISTSEDLSQESAGSDEWEYFQE